MHRITLTPLTVALLFLTSCSDPSSIAKKLLEKKCYQESKGYLKIVNFVKKDAIRMKRHGVNYYIITYDMEVEGVKDGGYADICARHGKYGAVMSFIVRDNYSEDDCHVFPVEKGHRYKVEGLFNQNIKTMTLVEHENGWVIKHFGGE